MKLLYATLLSLGIVSPSYAGGSFDSASRTLLYFEVPLAGTQQLGRSSLGLRLESGAITEGRHLALMDLRLEERRGVQFRLHGVPVFRYDGSVEESLGLPESVEGGFPWWGWALGGAAAACLLEAGICEDDDDEGSGYVPPGE